MWSVMRPGITVRRRALRKLAARGPLLLLLAFLTSCQPKPAWLGGSGPLAVEGLCPVSTDQMTHMNEDDVIEWVVEEFGRSPRQVQHTRGASVAIYGWHVWGMDDSAYLHEGYLVRVTLDDIEGGPTFGEIVAGSGAPEMVFAYNGGVEQVLYSVGLRYPARGVTVYTSGYADPLDLRHDGELLLELTEDMPVDRIDCYLPGRMEDVLRDSYLLDADGVEYNMACTVPWPGFGELVRLCW